MSITIQQPRTTKTVFHASMMDVFAQKTAINVTTGNVAHVSTLIKVNAHLALLMQMARMTWPTDTANVTVITISTKLLMLVNNVTASAKSALTSEMVPMSTVPHAKLVTINRLEHPSV